MYLKSKERWQCFDAGDDCLAVEPSQRRDCGPGVDKATCVEKGCCYDEADSDVARIRCYYSISMCKYHTFIHQKILILWFKNPFLRGLSLRHCYNIFFLVMKTCLKCTNVSALALLPVLKRELCRSKLNGCFSCSLRCRK